MLLDDITFDLNGHNLNVSKTGAGA